MAMGKVFEIAFKINAVMQGSFSSQMNAAGRVMQNLGQQSRLIAAEQRQLDRAWQQSQTQIRAYGLQMQRLAAQYQQGRITQAQYQQSAGRIAEQMRTAGMSADQYRQHLERLRQEMERNRQTQENLRQAQARQQTARSQFSAATSGVMAAGMNVAIATAPLAGAVAVAANFEQAMAKVKAITQADDEQLRQLTTTARELGEKTQFSASQAAEAMSYLGMAGWKTQQIMEGMPGLLNLAAAGGTDLARTADIISDDLTAFGLAADQAGHMADVFAHTITNSNTNIEMLGETMKYAAPVAHMFGASMEETAALAGLMANSGIKASMAGTSLRAGFLRLAGPPKMAAEAMEELGMSMQDITEEQKEAQMALASLGIELNDTSGPRKMSAILSELKEKTADLGREEKMATLGAIFGKNAVTGWMAVLEAGPAEFDKFVDALEHCDGEAAKMAEIMNNTAMGAMTRLKSAAESAAISVGSVFLPMLANAADSTAKWAGGLARLAAEHPKVTQAVGVLGAAIAGLYMYIKITTAASAAFRVVQTTTAAAMATYRAAVIASGVSLNGMTLATKIATAGQWAWNAAMAANPVGLVVAGIAALVAILYVLYQNFDKVRAFAAGIWESPAAAVLAFLTGPVGMLIYAASGIISNWETVKAWFVTLWENPQEALAQFTGFFRGKISGLMETAAPIFDGIRNFAAGIWESPAAAVLAFLTGPVGMLIYAASGIISNWETVKAWFVTLWENPRAALLEFGAFVTGKIAYTIGYVLGYLSTVPGKIQSFATEAGAYIMTLPGRMREAGTAFLAAALAWLQETYNTATNWISSMVESVFVFLMNLPTACAEAGTAFVAAAEAWAAEAYHAVMNWINQLPGAISNAISGAWEGIKAKFSAGFSIGVNAASNAAGGIYQKGAFLTTFAEEGPEAAIPLDGSRRAIGLWQKAGEILGIGQDRSTPAGVLAGMQVRGAENPAPAFSAPPITMNLTFNGPTEAQKVQEAVEQAGQTMQRDFAEQMAEWEHERGRRYFG